MNIEGRISGLSVYIPIFYEYFLNFFQYIGIKFTFRK
jgi:hypothetical protein